MQLVKCCLLQNSNDPVVRDIYKIKEDRVTSHAARWSGPKALQALLPVAEHNIRFAGQKGSSGLGASKSGLLHRDSDAEGSAGKGHRSAGR